MSNPVEEARSLVIANQETWLASNADLLARLDAINRKARVVSNEAEAKIALLEIIALCDGTEAPDA